MCLATGLAFPSWNIQMVGISRSTSQFMVCSMSTSTGWLATDILCYQTAGVPEYTGKPGVFLCGSQRLLKNILKINLFVLKV